MKTFTKPAALLIFFALFHLSGFSQSMNQMTYLAHTVEAGHLHVNFAIPHNGIIDFQLFDNAGNKIWTNYYTKSVGENKIVIRLHQLEHGETYKYSIGYKGNKHDWEFTAQHGY